MKKTYTYNVFIVINIFYKCSDYSGCMAKVMSGRNFMSIAGRRVPVIACDECHTWFHQVCVGFHDNASMPAKWFCSSCGGSDAAYSQGLPLSNIIEVARKSTVLEEKFRRGETFNPTVATELRKIFTPAAAVAEAAGSPKRQRTML